MCGWWVLAYELQDQLTTWIILPYGVSEAISMKLLVLICSLYLSGWFDCIGILYISICISGNL